MNHKSTTHEEVFFHLQVEDELEKYRGATVFARRSLLTEDYWEATVAVCSFNDAFCRKKGRTVSRRRFFADPMQRYHLAHKPTYQDAETMVVDTLNALTNQ